MSSWFMLCSFKFTLAWCQPGPDCLLMTYTQCNQLDSLTAMWPREVCSKRPQWKLLGISPKKKIDHYTVLGNSIQIQSTFFYKYERHWGTTLHSFLGSRCLLALSFSCCAVSFSFIDQASWGLISLLIIQPNAPFVLVIFSILQTFFYIYKK